MLLDECCIYLFVSHELERSGMGLFGIHENPYDRCVNFVVQMRQM
jgi:hypothetical protein